MNFDGRAREDQKLTFYRRRATSPLENINDKHIEYNIKQAIDN